MPQCKQRSHNVQLNSKVVADTEMCNLMSLAYCCKEMLWSDAIQPMGEI